MRTLVKTLLRQETRVKALLERQTTSESMELLLIDLAECQKYVSPIARAWYVIRSAEGKQWP
jgi:hypothetical protein